MRKILLTFLLFTLLAQCPTCPKTATPVYAQTNPAPRPAQTTTEQVSNAELPYKYIISRSADDFVPTVSGATFAIATLADDRLDMELIFRVGQRLTYSKLTDDAPLDFKPAWINNGQDILFDSSRDKMVAIWKLTLSEGKPVLFIKAPKDGMCFDAAVSPDESQVAYTRTNFIDVGWWTMYIVPPISKVSPEQFQIIIRNVQDGSDRILTYGMMPSWSPDGKKIAYSLFDGASWSIWLADAETGQRNQVTNPVGSSDITPVWSPDGQWLAFCRVDNKSKASDIWVVRNDGTYPTQLTNTPTRGEGGPCWTDDGIYFHTDAGEGTPYDIALLEKENLPKISQTSITTMQKNVSKSRLTIEILNSTTIPKLAAKTSSLLKRNGYNVADVGNSKRERNLHKGKIYYKPGFKEQARKIAELIPGTQLLQESKKFRYDIVIVLGRNTKY